MKKSTIPVVFDHLPSGVKKTRGNFVYFTEAS